MCQERHHRHTQIRRWAACILVLLLLCACSNSTPLPSGSESARLPATIVPSTPITPTILSSLRQTVAHAIFIPTNLPAGLVPQALAPSNPNTPGVHIKYQTPDGTVALDVVNGPAGCCLDADPRKTGETLVLPNGISAHLLEHIEPQYGGSILWWVQEGTYVALAGPQLTRDDLLKIAASMSKTADLSAP